MRTTHFILVRLSVFALLLLSASLRAETHLRTVTANLSSGRLQSYEDSAIRIFQALQPDLVAIQEFNYADNTPEALREFVDKAFGPGFHYFRGSGKRKLIPNGIISRYPILESGQIEDPTVSDRGLVWAKIAIPGKTPLWVFSVHLLRDLPARNQEARLLVKLIKEKIPKGDYLLVAGDFNTAHRQEGSLQILREVVTDRHVPADQTGNSNTTLFRNHPYDYLLPNPQLDQYHRCVQGFSGLLDGERGPVFPDGLVFDSRVFRPLDDVPPVLKTDSAAPKVQHMAVVKDFSLPAR